MYTPNTRVPLVKIFCHKSAVNTVKVSNNGNYMVTTGTDGYWKIWDLRTYR